jgi:hypothetical protein
VTKYSRSLILGCSVLALSACGPEDIASPGSGGNITINNPAAPAPTPSPTPTPTAPVGVVPAAGCPTVATDSGTITGPSGTWRVCSLPRVITSSQTLPRIPGLLYRLDGRTDIGCDGGFTVPTSGAPFATSTVGCPSASLTADTNVTLTIEPGVIIYANTGQSWLVANRGNRLNAVGTATRPVIFTSRDNVLGLNTGTSQGQWGGVVLLGRGTTTDCNFGTVGSNTCERQTEGAPDPARYGGTNNADNSGRLSYVQIRYSGFVLSGTSELQGLTTGSIGSGTVLDHIQSHNSSDDGAEFFGGVVNMKYYIADGADDDSVDVDTGAQMNLQYAIIAPRSGFGDGLMEIDSNNNESDTPRTTLQVANFTAVQPAVSSANESSGNTNAGTLFRGNSDTTLINGIIASPNNECVRVNGSGSLANRATLTARSVALSCNSTKYLATGTAGITYTTAEIGGVFTGNNNNDALTSTLTGLFVNGANETGVPATDPKTFAAFFDTTTWIGAVRNSTDTWYAGWTCSSANLSLGANTGDCTTIPVFS